MIRPSSLSSFAAAPAAPATDEVPTASEFATLHGALRARLVATAWRRLRDRDLAEDVAQEAFLRLLEHGDAVPRQARSKWLFRVLANCGIICL